MQEGLVELTSPDALRQLQSDPMIQLLESLPDQVEQALRTDQTAHLSRTGNQFRQLVICGLGGSAIGGDLLRACIGDLLPLPCISVRDYALPGYVSAESLVIVCSYSGETEETLAAFQEALNQGAQVVALTSGGTLARRCKSGKLTCFELPPAIPPRVAVGYSLVILLVLMERLGLASGQIDSVGRTLKSLRRSVNDFSPSNSDNNLAIELALKLTGRLPVVLGSQDRLDAMARRWAGQLSENSKVPAFYGSLPEAAHNSVAGWLQAGPLVERLSFLVLSDVDDHPRLRLLTEILVDELNESPAQVQVIQGVGDSRLERIWWLLLLGDFASTYLAFLRGVNATSIEAIERLKARMEHPK